MEKGQKHLEPQDRGNCSTIIVGKDASETGLLLVAHNEDDYDVTVQMHRVPRVKHKEGETISFADAEAVIPEVAETYAYHWSEFRCLGGISFADCYVNEWGVAVLSNSCRPCKLTEAEPQEAGLGYGLRRLITERAKTAREGVEIAAELVSKYGYISSRTYQICDKNEAWVFQVPTGKRYVARRVPDDEVYFIPNHFTIHQIDWSDREHKNFYFSEDLVEYPLRHGWYTPAKAGDYSDFDFAAAYQEGADKAHNKSRTRDAWRMLVSKTPECARPFSMKPDRKYGVKDLMKILRAHFEDSAVDFSEGYERNPHVDRDPSSLCNAMTAESEVIEFHEIPALTCIWRTTPKPCITPFVPWYLGITKVPRGYGWLDPVVSQPTHFRPAQSELAYDPQKAYWSFKMLQYLTEFNYKDTHDIIVESYKKLEERWMAERSAIVDAYQSLADANLELATEFLTGYTATQAQAAWDWANGMIEQLGEAKIMSNSSCGFVPKE